jgi:hypothetical protein
MFSMLRVLELDMRSCLSTSSTRIEQEVGGTTPVLGSRKILILEFFLVACN